MTDDRRTLARDLGDQRRRRQKEAGRTEPLTKHASYCPASRDPDSFCTCDDRWRS